MTKNMGLADRTIRGLIGVIIILLGVVFKSWWGLVGIVPIATTLTGWCPAYLPFRFSTIRGKTTGKQSSKP